MPVANLNLNVHHVTRVEGHGNIVVRIQDGALKECFFRVVEAPRYFESFCRGRRYDEMSFVTSRICGICGVGHTLTSLKATEAAMRVPVSDQTVVLRKLLADASFLQSHVLHIYFLVAPDYAGVGSVIPLVEAAPDVVQRALRLKKLANDYCDLLGGRTIHPTSTWVGGFTSVPPAREIEAMLRRLEAAKDDILATVETVHALATQAAGKGFLPLDFQRETEYVSLRSSLPELAIYDGNICSSDVGETPDTNYRQVTNEFLPPTSTSKQTRYNRASYMVGALSRVNNNADKLGDLAKGVAAKFGVRKFPVHNPFLIPVAQLVEVAEIWERDLKWLPQLLDEGVDPTNSVVRPKDIKVRAGTGVGCTEVPRGILFHEYAYDDHGLCQSANCIIPTGQNFANINEDMHALVPWLVARGADKDQIRFALEMLVRAYDPCISCSVHTMDVTFVE
jgi:coenzyme F420-reducing hydrogenase alpha subunit